MMHGVVAIAMAGKSCRLQRTGKSAERTPKYDHGNQGKDVLVNDRTFRRGTEHGLGGIRIRVEAWLKLYLCKVETDTCVTVGSGDSIDIVVSRVSL